MLIRQKWEKYENWEIAYEIAVFVLWILQQHLYRVECSHCPLRTKDSRLQGSFHTEIFLIISHSTEAEIKPSLSVIKGELIVISAAFVLLPLPLKPLTWREVLFLHHISVLGQDPARGFRCSKVSTVSQDPQGLWNEYKKVSCMPDTGTWKWKET